MLLMDVSLVFSFNFFRFLLNDAIISIKVLKFLESSFLLLLVATGLRSTITP